MKARSKYFWTPTHQPNGVYCSAGCGHHCTRAEFDRATKGAKKLAAKLGKGWKPRVWENMGWFYEVQKNNVVVSLGGSLPPGRARYYARFNNPVHQTMSQGSTPQDAVDDALRKAWIMRQELAEALAPWDASVTKLMSGQR
jgi:hypothetical protein